MTQTAPPLVRPARLLEKRERSDIRSLLAEADIQIDGDRPWDPQLHDDQVFERAVAGGSLALGESYMDGDWEVDQLDEFFARLLRARLDSLAHPASLFLPALRYRISNRQSARRARQVADVHYNLGNDFYAAMLDPRMVYSCGYWKAAGTLEEAQEAKLDLICRKLQLRPGMRLLDIGCGWGSLMAYAAERYGVRCLGVTVSGKQVEFARRRYAGLPLEFRLQDYREIDEPFDRIASVGMFEHVGHKNHRAFMETAHRCLSGTGLFLLHTIGKRRRSSVADPWIDKYIFPNGELPALDQVAEALDDLFVAEDLHNFGAYYDPTLLAWHRNFESSWPRFAERLGERFHRMWRYYLLSCAGAFRARNLQLWQWVLSKRGILGGYQRAD